MFWHYYSILGFVKILSYGFVTVIAGILSKQFSLRDVGSFG